MILIWLFQNAGNRWTAALANANDGSDRHPQVAASLRVLFKGKEMAAGSRSERILPRRIGVGVKIKCYRALQ
jgi:hypothetical protein